MLYPLSYRRSSLTLSKGVSGLKFRTESSTYNSRMTSAKKSKVIALGAIFTALVVGLSGCGSNPAKNSDAWTAKQQKSISNKWLPVRSQECQLFIDMFQNFNTVISERSTATTNEQAAKAIRDFQSFTSEATLALNQEIKFTKSEGNKAYAQRFLKFVTGFTDAKNFNQKKASDLLLEAKWLIYNPPTDCINP